MSDSDSEFCPDDAPAQASAPRINAHRPSETFTDVDLSPVEIPPRSTLISLKLQGSRSPHVESLWSYLHRLAEAHATLLSHLLREILLPVLGFQKTRAGFDSRRVLLPLTGRQVADVVEGMTRQEHLSAATFHPVSSALGLSVTARATRALCPECLASDIIPHERLVWSVGEVAVCPIHRRRLRLRCPACASLQQYSSTLEYPGRCCSCNTPLNTFTDSEDDQPISEFEVWTASQVGELLTAAGNYGQEQTVKEFWRTNVKTIASLPTIGGTTGLAARIGGARSIACGWQRRGLGISLAHATRIAWVAGIDLTQLFFQLLEPSGLKVRSLPNGLAEERRDYRRISVSSDSAALFVAALQLSAQNPFRAPRSGELERVAGVHNKHPSFRDTAFRRLMFRLRRNEMQFRHKERIWRSVCDVHQAALKTVEAGTRLTRKTVGARMANPSALSDALFRKYLAWFKRRRKQGDPAVARSKRAPTDVRAFWTLEKYTPTKE